MEVIDGQWFMSGVSKNDPRCVHSAEELLSVIDKVGFLPLFENEVPGFSVENITQAKNWWCGREKVDPWEWRAILARTGKVAYGKFFGKKAGFVSKEWFPVFANFRRDGYDFDSRYEEGKADHREKLIMDLFWPKEGELWEVDPKKAREMDLFSFEVKEKAGFGKNGEKGFEGTCSKLQMGTYLLVKDFVQRRNKEGEPYGWAIARYTLPEYLWGYNFVTGKYTEAPRESGRKIVEHIGKYYDCDEKTIRRVIK